MEYASSFYRKKYVPYMLFPEIRIIAIITNKITLRINGRHFQSKFRFILALSDCIRLFACSLNYNGHIIL